VAQSEILKGARLSDRRRAPRGGTRAEIETLVQSFLTRSDIIQLVDEER
jgi:hypothetical protein